jgi:hypothetical protein
LIGLEKQKEKGTKEKEKKEKGKKSLEQASCI